MKWMGVFVLLLLVSCGKQPGTSTSAPVAPSGPVLSLLSSKCTTQYGFRYCEGFVKNIGTRVLGGDVTERMIVEVVWIDANNTPQTSDAGFVIANPLAPGQESSWKTGPAKDDGSPRYRVQFKTILGATIQAQDDRKP